ncbi:type II and III secretion system protein [Candidatus Dependentiae bacterium]|nr:type II and III secretion system protein [Candidatus Dependentiae bacterium]
MKHAGIMLILLLEAITYPAVELPAGNNSCVSPPTPLAQVPHPLAITGLENDRKTALMQQPVQANSLSAGEGDCLLAIARKQLASSWQAPIFAMPISVTVAQASLADAIALIAAAANITIIVDTAVTGTISLQVHNMPLGDVLQMVCQQVKPVVTLVQESTWWRLVCLSEAIALMRQRLAYDTHVAMMQLQHIHLDVATIQTIEQCWHKIINQAAQESYLHLDAAQGQIFYRAPEVLAQEFQAYIKHIDRPRLSVRIDVIVVIAEKNFNFDIGLDWSGIYNRQQTLAAKHDRFGFVGIGGSLMDYPTPDKPVVNPPNLQGSTNIFVDPLHFALNLFNSGASLLTGRRHDANQPGAITIPLVFGGADLSVARLNAVLNAAQQEAELQITNNPSLLTGNHQTAKLLIGKSIPLQTIVEDLQANLTRNITTINFKEIGTVIEFTPVIAPDGASLALDVYIEDSVVTEGTTRANERGIMVNPPTISMIKIKNRVDLMNGQTTVIGGLSYQYNSDAQTVVPWLYRLPVLGWLFKACFLRKEEKERYIFITPTIIDPQCQLSASAQKNPFNLEQAEGIGG